MNNFSQSDETSVGERIVALDFEGLKSCVGRELGVSNWIGVGQALVNDFGASTFDPDPMHIDVDWAREHSPFGQTILFGFQTMSLLTCMFHDVLPGGAHDHFRKGVGLNYGFDRMRLMTPVLAGSKVRGRFFLNEIRMRDKLSCVQKYDVTVEIHGEEKPALVGQWLVLWANRFEGSLAK